MISGTVSTEGSPTILVEIDGRSWPTVYPSRHDILLVHV